MRTRFFWGPVLNGSARCTVLQLWLLLEIRGYRCVLCSLETTKFSISEGHPCVRHHKNYKQLSYWSVGNNTKNIMQKKLRNFLSQSTYWKYHNYLDKKCTGGDISERWARKSPSIIYLGLAQIDEMIQTYFLDTGTSMLLEIALINWWSCTVFISPGSGDDCTILVINL